MTYLVKNKKYEKIVKKLPIVAHVDMLECDQTGYWLEAMERSGNRSITIATNAPVHTLYETKFPLISKREAYTIRDCIAITFSGHSYDSLSECFSKCKVLYVNNLYYLYASMNGHKYKFFKELESDIFNHIVVPISQGIYENVNYTKVIYPFDFSAWNSFFTEIEKNC